VAGGLYDEIADCAHLAGRSAETIDPDPGHRAAYDDAYHAYRRLFDSLRPMYGRGGAGRSRQ